MKLALRLPMTMSNSILFLILSVLCFSIDLIIATDGYFLWLGASALIISLLAYFAPALGLGPLGIGFAILSVILITLYKQWKKKHPDQIEKPNLNKITSRYVGKTYEIVEVFDDSAKIRIGDALWRVKSEDKELFKIGNVVRVVDQLSSNELKVIAPDVDYLEDNSKVDKPSDQHSINRTTLKSLIESKHAHRYSEMVDAFVKIHEIYKSEDHFNYQRTAFYNTYLPMTNDVFKKMESQITLDKDEQMHIKNTMTQIQNWLNDIAAVYNEGKKNKLLSKIDVLKTLSKEYQ